ncbi:MAG: hypothetical protein QXN56_06190, partial [Candidatus Hadarchaeum sp.]
MSETDKQNSLLLLSKFVSSWVSDYILIVFSTSCDVGDIPHGSRCSEYVIFDIFEISRILAPSIVHEQINTIFSLWLSWNMSHKFSVEVDKRLIKVKHAIGTACDLPLRQVK